MFKSRMNKYKGLYYLPTVQLNWNSLRRDLEKEIHDEGLRDGPLDI